MSRRTTGIPHIEPRDLVSKRMLMPNEPIVTHETVELQERMRFEPRFLAEASRLRVTAPPSR